MTKQKNVLDFTGKRVRLNGKALSKFDLAHLVDSIRPDFSWLIIYDAFTYEQLVENILYLHNFHNCGIVLDIWKREYFIRTK